MGLDITAHDNIGKYLSDKWTDGLEGLIEEGGAIYLYNMGDQYSEFAGRADAIKTGVHSVFEGTNVIKFCAGSYSGYGAWRNELAQLAGYPAFGDHNPYSRGAWGASGGPFWELINFSDCEGVIGPQTSEKLHNDFLTYLPSIDGKNAYFQDKYLSFMEAFELAAKGGFVKFH